MSLSCYLFRAWKISRALTFRVELLSLSRTRFRVFFSVINHAVDGKIRNRKNDGEQKKKKKMSERTKSRKKRSVLWQMCVSVRCVCLCRTQWDACLLHDSRKWETTHHSSLFALAKRFVIIWYLCSHPSALVHSLKHPYGGREQSIVWLHHHSFIRSFAYPSQRNKV